MLVAPTNALEASRPPDERAVRVDAIPRASASTSPQSSSNAPRGAYEATASREALYALEAVAALFEPQLRGVNRWPMTCYSRHHAHAVVRSSCCDLRLCRAVGGVRPPKATVAARRGMHDESRLCRRIVMHTWRFGGLAHRDVHDIVLDERRLPGPLLLPFLLDLLQRRPGRRPEPLRSGLPRRQRMRSGPDLWFWRQVRRRAERLSFPFRLRKRRGLFRRRSIGVGPRGRLSRRRRFLSPLPHDVRHFVSL
jgi:hypothetical protein